MRSEEEIRKLKEELEADGPSPNGIDMVCLSNAGGFWLDCLDWVLGEGGEKGE